MKLELTSGCIADDFTLGNEKVCNLSEEKLKEVFAKVSDKIIKTPLVDNKHIELQGILYQMVESFYDTYETSDPCECCGDYIETYTIDV